MEGRDAAPRSKSLPGCCAAIRESAEMPRREYADSGTGEPSYSCECTTPSSSMVTFTEMLSRYCRIRDFHSSVSARAV